MPLVYISQLSVHIHIHLNSSIDRHYGHLSKASIQDPKAILQRAQMIPK